LAAELKSGDNKKDDVNKQPDDGNKDNSTGEAWQTEMVSGVQDVVNAVERIYACAPDCVAIDVEGANLCREGHVALVQVGVEEIRTIFLFDVSTLGDAVFWDGSPPPKNENENESTGEERGAPPSKNESRTTLRLLGHLLEDAEVTKLLFDGRGDGDALHHLHGVSLRNVLDVQVYFTVRRMPKRVGSLLGLGQVS
jgi:exonuclease 3'-5' domain-containing protein 1